jgi:hypothetical protein
MIPTRVYVGALDCMVSVTHSYKQRAWPVMIDSWDEPCAQA